MRRQARAMLTALGIAAIGVLGVLSAPSPSPAVDLGSAAMAWEGPLARGRQVDLNAADVSDLQRLPGIGAVLADRIVVSRRRHGRFQDVGELVRVRGIGRATVAALEDYVRVR